MTKILEKIESEVICIIDDKQYQYANGKDAYQTIISNYSIHLLKLLTIKSSLTLFQKRITKNKIGKKIIRSNSVKNQVFSKGGKYEVLLYN